MIIQSFKFSLCLLLSFTLGMDYLNSSNYAAGEGGAVSSCPGPSFF